MERKEAIHYLKVLSEKESIFQLEIREAIGFAIVELETTQIDKEEEIDDAGEDD